LEKARQTSLSVALSNYEQYAHKNELAQPYFQIGAVPATPFNSEYPVFDLCTCGGSLVIFPRAGSRVVSSELEQEAEKERLRNLVEEMRSLKQTVKSQQCNVFKKQPEIGGSPASAYSEQEATSVAELVRKIETHAQERENLLQAQISALQVDVRRSKRGGKARCRHK